MVVPDADRPFPARRLARWLGTVVAAATIVLGTWSWWASVMPGAYPVTDMGVADYGGGARSVGAGHGHGHGHGHGNGSGASSGAGVSVDDLVADPARAADVRVELVARQGEVTLADGSSFRGYTINGSTPGPEIRAQQGDLVEVTLVNEGVPGGATLHWHGVDVPNAMDGVAGVTQDAVPPGESFTYRFVAEQVGTFWYHSHQVSHEQVVGGLYGALVLEPMDAADAPPDAVAMLHTYPGGARTLNGRTGELHHEAAAGDVVRVRVVNTDGSPTSAWVAGAPFRLVAIDGTEVVGPTEVYDQRVLVTAGGRADLEVRVPADGAVRLHLPGVSMVVGPPGEQAPVRTASPPTLLDPLTYGTPAPPTFDPDAADRRFDYSIGRRPGFLRGLPGYWWTVNGAMGAKVPMFMVEEGDVVRMRISNHSGEVHPMHLHGHHVLVLARDGVPAQGSPWWVDSLDVGHGETYDVAFVADNPGIWMDHCHNLPHAVEGLTAHVAYEGVSTPYLVGRDTTNEPE